MSVDRRRFLALGYLLSQREAQLPMQKRFACNLSIKRAHSFETCPEYWRHATHYVDETHPS